MQTRSVARRSRYKRLPGFLLLPQLPRSFASRTLIRSGFALLLFFAVTDPVGLIAQQRNPAGPASSHKNEKVLSNDASEVDKGRIESSLIKRIVLLPVRWGRSLVSPLFTEEVAKSPRPVTDSSSTARRTTTSEDQPALNYAEVSSPRPRAMLCSSPLKYESRNQVNPPPLQVNVVSGRIIDEVGELGGSVREIGPVDGACVGLFTETDHQLKAFVVADDEGQFKFDGIPAGRYRLVVRAGLLCVANVPVRVVAKKSNNQNRNQIVVHMRTAGIDTCSYADAPVAEPTAPVIAELIQYGQARLVERLKLLVEYQSTQNWEKQFDLLSVLVTQGDSKEDHSKRLRQGYAEGLGDLLVDFTPKSATYEGGGPSDVVIFGCATVRRNGSIVELYASVEAYREKQDWYFSPVGIITPVDGKPEPCPYAKSNR
jgi:hypothetical protein